MALSGARSAAMTAYIAAAVAVAGTKDPVAMTNAQKYVDMAKAASDAAAATFVMAESYRMAAEGHRDSAIKATYMRGLGLTALANKIINQSAIDNAVLARIFHRGMAWAYAWMPKRMESVLTLRRHKLLSSGRNDKKRQRWTWS